MSSNDPTAPGVQYLTIDPEYSGQRIDNFLLRILKGVPKSYIYRIVRKGEVRINKGRIKADYRLQSGDQLRIPPLRMATQAPPTKPGKWVLESLANAILYEDNGLLVINKPSGIAVHGGSGINYGVIEALRELRPQEKGLELVHRIDRDTSGCLMLAKRRSALRGYHQQLQQGEIEKRYLAMITGNWGGEQRRRVDAPLQKNTLRSGERVVRVDPEGKHALTLFQVVESFSQVTLVEALLRTGRTHQIRVHLAHLGTPILGDEKYGTPASDALSKEIGLKRLALHAASLTLPRPDQPPLRIEAPLDPALRDTLKKLREL